MILVWDNGESYSANEIRFIDIGNVSVEHATTLMKMRDEDGFALGVAERIEWFNGGFVDLVDTVGWKFDLNKAGDVPLYLCERIVSGELKRQRELLASARADHPTMTTWHSNIQRSIAGFEAQAASIRAFATSPRGES